MVNPFIVTPILVMIDRYDLNLKIYSRGVSVLFKKDLPVQILNVHRSIDGRKLLINVKFEDKTFSLVNVYAPNNESNRLDFFKKLKLFISHHCIDQNNIIQLLTGDEGNI